MAEFTANNRAPETITCTLYFVIHGTDPWMAFSNTPTEVRHHWRQDANQMEVTIDQIQEHVGVEMGHRQAIEQQGAN